jgi:serine/threonine protein kinase
MGVVYAARDERLDRTVALKTIRGETDETSRKTTLRKIKHRREVFRISGAIQPTRSHLSWHRVC